MGSSSGVLAAKSRIHFGKIKQNYSHISPPLPQHKIDKHVNIVIF